MHGDARRGKDNLKDNYKLHAWTYAIDCKNPGRVLEVDQGVRLALTPDNEVPINNNHLLFSAAFSTNIKFSWRLNNVRHGTD
jgi:hypothetical protein